MKELDGPVTASGGVAIFGAGDACCGFSSIVQAGLLAGRWLSTLAMLLFSCGECSSGIADSGVEGTPSGLEGP
jgi:hypothetical protein